MFAGPTTRNAAIAIPASTVAVMADVAMPTCIDGRVYVADVMARAYWATTTCN